MGQVLHGSATTTAAVRRAIQHSQESLRVLAKRYGINPKTVAKWKQRGSVTDRPTGPREPRSTVLSMEDEAIIVAFRQHTLLPLDDCLYALQATIPRSDPIIIPSLSSAPWHRSTPRGPGKQADQEGFQSQLSRMNCQTFSCGFSSGHFGGSGTIVMLCGHVKLVGQMPSGLIDQQRCVPPGRDIGRDRRQVQVSSPCCTRAGPGRRPCPPWGRSRRRCRSTRCAGPAARRAGCRACAQRRVILFFWPIRASSPNQISISPGSRPCWCAIAASCGGPLF